MSNILLSIVVPMYNVEKYITRCLESCINQDLCDSDYEIIVVNDGSPDNSLELAERFASEHINVKVISQKNGGLSAARNTGLRNAKGEYVWFVDSDDWIKRNCLKNIIEITQKHDLDVLRISAADVVGDNEKRILSYEEGKVTKGKELLSKGITFCVPFYIWRKNFLEENSLCFYEGIYHEDNEFTPRALFLAQRVTSLNDVLYFVYQNPNSITRSFNPKKAYDCMIVLNSLHAFRLNNDKGVKNSFNYIITGTYNAALFEIVDLEERDQKELAEQIYKNKWIYDDLINSGRLVYKVEGLLMKLFPKHPITIYRILNFFDRRSIKQ